MDNRICIIRTQFKDTNTFAKDTSYGYRISDSYGSAFSTKKKTLMVNPNLNTALCDLCDGIRDAFLGSIENVVIKAAGRELISNWNEHRANDPIDEALEMKEWEAEVEKMS